MGLGCAGRVAGTNPGKCATCGATGQPCCSNGASCSAGHRCVMAACQACGGKGQPCCSGGGIAACQAGLFCNGGGMGVVGTCGTAVAPTPDASVGN